MVPKVNKLLRHVINTLSEETLPYLEQATWTTANVRASIAVLTYIEDMLEHGVSELEKQNDAMATALDAALKQRGDWINPELQGKLETAAKLTEKPAASLDEYEERNMQFKEVLSELVRASLQQPRQSEFNDLIHAKLMIVSESESVLAERTRQLPMF